ncbi:hypothetical protein KAZ57_00175 [Patescibacteria group bacterium]|nr:hypothetical protein [Patescibacteria group bacterium]
MLDKTDQIILLDFIRSVAESKLKDNFIPLVVIATKENDSLLQYFPPQAQEKAGVIRIETQGYSTILDNLKDLATHKQYILIEITGPIPDEIYTQLQNLGSRGQIDITETVGGESFGMTIPQDTLVIISGTRKLLESQQDNLINLSSYFMEI